MDIIAIVIATAALVCACQVIATARRAARVRQNLFAPERSLT